MRPPSFRDVFSAIMRRRFSSLCSHELRWLREYASKHDLPLEALVKRRHRGEPLQYILGDAPFLDIDVGCQSPTLIPRPETEEWTAKLIQSLKGSRGIRLLDIGCGSGCISIAIAQAIGTILRFGAALLCVLISSSTFSIKRGFGNRNRPLFFRFGTCRKQSSSQFCSQLRVSKSACGWIHRIAGISVIPDH